jgi:hypothetical protein
MRGKRSDQSISTAGEQAHPAAFHARYETIAVVLDLVQPAGARSRNAGGGRNARLDEAGWQYTWTRHGHAASWHKATSGSKLPDCGSFTRG